MRWEQSVEYAALSDIGFRRQNNQDNCVVQIAQNPDLFQQRGHLFVVADGMGGHAVGELASKIAVDAVPLSFFKLLQLPGPEALRQAIADANMAIYERGQKNREFLNMGTTCTALVLSPHGAYAGHVGDTRLYRLRDQRIDQLTFDHSLQWERARSTRHRLDEVTINEPRNVITRCLGPEPQVQVDLEGPFPVMAGDIYILCSDGLSSLVTDQEIGVAARELPPPDACRLLVNLANLRGGNDNITVIIVRVGPVPKGLPPLSDAPIADRGGLGWEWLAAFAGISLLVALAVTLFVVNKPVEAVLTVAATTVAIGVAVLKWLRLPTPVEFSTITDTILWRPHRSASARLDRKFLAELVHLEQALEHTAQEEAWEIDWEAHGKAVERASLLLQKHAWSQAFGEVAAALQALMAGIQHPKRRQDQVAKWRARGMKKPPTDEIPLTDVAEAVAGDAKDANGESPDRPRTPQGGDASADDPLTRSEPQP